MSKFVIIPIEEFEQVIEAKDANDAMADFAFQMDSDMNQYFKAIPEEDYEMYKLEREIERDKQSIIEFMQTEYENEYEIKEKDAAKLAEKAYERYVSGTGETQYECIEAIYEEWLREKRK